MEILLFLPNCLLYYLFFFPIKIFCFYNFKTIGCLFKIAFGVDTSRLTLSDFGCNHPSSLKNNKKTKKFLIVTSNSDNIFKMETSSHSSLFIYAICERNY